MIEDTSSGSKRAAMILALLAAACSSGAIDSEAGSGVLDQQLFSTVPYRGVNLAGAEFGEGNLPGTYGTHYIYPDPASAAYFTGKGMNTFRLPFRWERLQRSLFGGLDATELGRLRSTVSGLNSRGATVLLDPHNYARYQGTVVGSGSVTNAAFADFWSRLAGEFKSSNVIFGLMNEPNEMSTEAWVQAANAAIVGIRGTGATNLILVPGNAWSGAHSWNQTWYGTSNAVAMLQITDSGNNYAFEAHQYLDADSSGTSSSCVSATIGSERLATFTNWLSSNNKRGFIGEFGGGRDATCAAAIDNAVDHIEANASRYLGWTYWAAGPWWGDYYTTLEPLNGVDRPQMDALESHLTGSQGSTCTDGVKNGTETGVDCGGSCAACPTTPSCTDGVKNGTETGVDCGGSCVACSTAGCAAFVQPMAGTAGYKIDDKVTFNGSAYRSLINGNYWSPSAAPQYWASTTCSTTASCTDGVKNGTETGVDCGGSCAACPPTASCTDGVKNGTETGVDCGGSCVACSTTGCSAYVQPYAGQPGYKVGDKVTFSGSAYRSLINNNYWSPGAAPQYWAATTCP
jgi:endoglucanase